MKRRIFWIATVVAVVAVAAMAVRLSRPVPKVLAATCSNALLDGYYGGYYFGSVNGGKDNSVEVWYFDGTSTFSMNLYQVDNGTLTSSTLTGTYSLGLSGNNGCVGTITPNSGSTRKIVPVDSGNEVFSTLTTSPANVTEVMKKQ